MPGPLEGIRVLDLTIMQNGAYATMMLADMGAEVIKIEDPTRGDPARGMAAPVWFEANNRNKKGITLNLKNPEGRQVLYRLAEGADVAATSFRLGVPEKLGFGYEALVKHNPKIIYAHCPGWGSRGPEAGQGVNDILGYARSGAAMALAEPGKPPSCPASISMADQIGGMMFGYGIVLALLARERFGLGQRVEVSQLGSMIIFQHNSFYRYTLMGGLPRRTRREDSPNPLFEFYQGKDGAWLALGCAQSDRYWPGICRALSLEPLERDPRFKSAADRAQQSRELMALLEERFATRPAAEWVRLLTQREVLATRVLDYPDVVEDVQATANQYFIDFEHRDLGRVKIVGVPVQLSETPGAVRMPAPRLGEHTAEVLVQAGYSQDEVARLRKQGAV